MLVCNTKLKVFVTLQSQIEGCFLEFIVVIADEWWLHLQLLNTNVSMLIGFFSYLVFCSLSSFLFRAVKGWLIILHMMNMKVSYIDVKYLVLNKFIVL